MYNEKNWPESAVPSSCCYLSDTTRLTASPATPRVGVTMKSMKPIWDWGTMVFCLYIYNTCYKLDFNKFPINLKNFFVTIKSSD